MVVQRLPDGLCSVLPSPEICVKEVHGGLEIQVFQHVSRRNLIEVPIAECCERTCPIIHYQRHTVHFHEVLERHGKILQVRVLPFDVFSVRCYRAPVVSALGNSPVAVDVIALVLRLKKNGEFLELLISFLVIRLSWNERSNRISIIILKFVHKCRTIVGNTTEFFHIMNCII